MAYKNHQIVDLTQPIYSGMPVFVGHPDNQLEGGLALEGSLYNVARGRCPRVTAVHLPLSGCCRFHLYIQVDKAIEGEQVSVGWSKAFTFV